MTPLDKDWAARMTPAEVAWCIEQINDRVPGQPVCVAEYRAAQVWKGSQVRRFKKMRDGYHPYYTTEWIAHRWNPSKGRHDRYVLGYNWHFD